MSIGNEKTEIINIRVSKEEKAQLIKMANEKHLNLSSYILTTLLSENDIDYSTATPTILNEEQFNRLLRILRNPPKANDNLKKMTICKNAQLEIAKEKK